MSSEGGGLQLWGYGTDDARWDENGIVCSPAALGLHHEVRAQPTEGYRRSLHGRRHVEPRETQAAHQRLLRRGEGMEMGEMGEMGEMVDDEREGLLNAFVNEICKGGK